jgi:CHAT domain-containing protein
MGVVVEEVGVGSTLEKAGLQPGDIVHTWERLPAPPANLQRAQGTIESVFDWRWLKVEQAPRGTVKLTGQREGEVKIFEAMLGEWDAILRPRMPEGMLADYSKGKGLIKAEDLEAGINLLQKVAEIAENQVEDRRLGSWLFLRIGDTWAKARRGDKAYGSYRAALDVAQEPLARVVIWQAIGAAQEKASEFDAGREAYSSAQEIRKRIWGESLAFAKGLNSLGRLDEKQGNLDAALNHWQCALEIRNELAPGSLDVASSLNNLGILAYSRDALDDATKFYEKSLEIFQKLAPTSLSVAASLNNLGNLAVSRGDLERATQYQEEALKIRRTLAPGSLGVAASLNNLGNLSSYGGDLDQAAAYYEEALEIFQESAPGSVDMAMLLYNLGDLASDRGDVDRALEYSEGALVIRQELAPNSLAVAGSLDILGILARNRGDLEQAAENFEDALKIQQKLAPDSLAEAASLHNLGILVQIQGDLDQAVEYHERSLIILQKLAPTGLDTASSLHKLGKLASDRGDLDRAVEYLEGSLAIEQKLAPRSSAEAETLHALATLRRTQGQLQLALSLFRQALQALEEQVTKLGGSRNVQADFRAQRADYYRDTIDLSLELHQPTEAFHALERSRARSFLAQLAERDLVFSDIPENLERQRRQIARHYDQTQAEIARLHPREEAEKIETLLTLLRQLRRDSDDAIEKIIKASPKIGALRYPRPLDLDAVRQALDPGTIMLSYSVGKDKTHLFILTREEKLQVKTLPFGEREIRAEVERVLQLQKRRSVPFFYTKPLHQAGERLYKILIQPAEGAIAKSKRVLIVPDGPLHLLPFALLVRKTDPLEEQGERDFEYLVEWKPLHSVLSATVYDELRNQRRNQPVESSTRLALVAFGDPKFPPERAGADLATDRSIDVHVRAAAGRGFDFRPLPYSREEVGRITALYPEGTARAFLGAEASEEQAKSIGKSARILHFATHGRYDNRFPLNSYLALTIPKEFRRDQDNGLLQAWEIFESVRLDADLVVLSACESGLGDEIDGEGLKGLTRAFQFAGARTVAASLWQVDDQATAELMLRFYRYLKMGVSKDEALRAAQLELIQNPIEMRNREMRNREMKNRHGQVVQKDLSSPYFWAAFQILGDWQ